MSLDYRLIEAEIPQPAENECTLTDEVMAYVVDCLRAHSQRFGRPVPQHALVVGDGGPLTAFHDGMPRIRFQEGSTDEQRHHQAGHEAFHAIWPEEVYHWSHEVMATWLSRERDLSRDPGYAEAQLAAWTDQASSMTFAEVVAFNLDTPDWPPSGYYARCALTAITLAEAEGSESLIGLAKDIGHGHHDSRERITAQWISGLTSPEAKALFD